MLWSRDLPQLFENVRPREADGTRVWDLLACSVWTQRKRRHLLGISLYQKLITPYEFLPVHRRCVIFLFVLFEKHRLARERSERSRTSGAREKNLYTIALAVNKSPAVYILSPGLDRLWRENRGSVNRLYRNPITNNFREQSQFPTRQHCAKDGLILERFGDMFYTVVSVPRDQVFSYTKIRTFMPGSSVRIILDSFYPLISKFENCQLQSDVCRSCDSKSPLPGKESTELY